MVVIKVERINFETSLDSKEQAHVTEIAMIIIMMLITLLLMIL